MGDRTNKTNGTNERFWRYPISPIGRIGLISPILNANAIVKVPLIKLGANKKDSQAESFSMSDNMPIICRGYMG